MLIASRIDGNAKLRLSLDDRGLAYGDGVFRTVLITDRQAVDSEGQVDHLTDDAQRLNLGVPSRARLLAELDWAGRLVENGCCKLLLTRAATHRGYAPGPASAIARLICLVYAGHGVPRGEPCRLRSCSLQLTQQAALAGIKHLNRLEQVLARAEWSDPAIDEGLLMDVDGMVVGGTMSNVFWVENERLTTPDLSLCGVAGRMRARVMQAAVELGMPCIQARVAAAHCRANASEFFLTNSLWGLRAVSHWEDIRFAPGPVALRIAEYLRLGSTC